MAHFAKISEENEVLSVLFVENEDAPNEAAGQAHLETHNNWPANLWIQTSYNTVNNTHKLGGTPFRGNYAGIGFTWDAANSIFWQPKPFASWTKHVASATWRSPLGEQPSITSEQKTQNNAGTHDWYYAWDESAYQADNTTGWVLTNSKA